MDLPQQQAAHAARAQQIAQSMTKGELAKLARQTYGWKGDEARTPKETIAEFCALAESANPAIDAEIIEQPKGDNSSVNLPARHNADSSNPADLITQALRTLMASMPAQMDEQRVKQLSAGAAREVLKSSEMDDVIGAYVSGHLDQLAQQLAPQLPQMAGKTITINAQGERREIEGRTHPQFEKVLKLLSAGQNVLLKGPAGCGKTTLAEQAAHAMGKQFGALHCSAGASESQLLGWLLPTGENGRFEYVAAQFARMFAEGGALFLVDEIDAADPNFLMVLNGALANGHLHVPQNWKQPSVKRGDGFGVIAAANTYGTGADALYVGRNQLDAATLDRFYVVEMDYDRELEQQLGYAEVCEWAWQLREKAAQARLRRVVSTRVIQRMTAAMGAGISFAEAKRDALTGWTRDELSKVGEYTA